MSDLVVHRGIGQPSKCRSCGTVIHFAKTTSGKTAPFEADPNGLWTIENGAARFLGTTTKQLELGEAPPPRFTSHFAKCKDADAWRKSNRSGEDA